MDLYLTDIITTNIPDVKIIQEKIYADHRGFLFEGYNKEKLLSCGIDTDFVQDNIIESYQHTIRGMHFQKPPFAQAKFLRVLYGEILDVCVDIRRDSKTYGKHVSTVLDDKDHKAIWIPKGFAHGFSVLSEKAIVTYKTDSPYNFEHDSGISYNDKELGIDWGFDMDLAITSDKDNLQQSFKNYKQAPCF